MQFAASFSGGKDSMLAVDRAVHAGVDVAYLFNIYDGVSERVRFHGTRANLIEAQAYALGIPLVQDCTGPHTYETVFLHTLDRLAGRGVRGILFGNIHLADIRAWYEERTTGRGFKHVEPLWGESGPALSREVAERGYVPLVVSVDLARSPRSWLGRTFDMDLIEEIEAQPDIDPSGERGEFHTFVQGGPLFSEALDLVLGPELEMEGHAILDMQTKE